MTTTTTPRATTPANVAIVRTIGKGERMTAVAVPEIIATLPEGFDPKVRGAVADAVHAWACGDAPRPAVTTGGKGEQTPTDYGQGHATLVKAVKRALATPSNTGTVLRASLSGEGGGSVTIPEDSPLYAALVALIRGEDADGE